MRGALYQDEVGAGASKFGLHPDTTYQFLIIGCFECIDHSLSQIPQLSPAGSSLRHGYDRFSLSRVRPYHDIVVDESSSNLVIQSFHLPKYNARVLRYLSFWDTLNSLVPFHFHSPSSPLEIQLRSPELPLTTL